MPGRTRFVACLGLEAIEASTPYVLVDLDDAVNFPHALTGEIHLLGLSLNAEKYSDGVYDIWIGVVTENDGTDGSVTWVHVFHLEASGNPTDSTDRFAQMIDFTLGGQNPEGLNLLVDASEATPRLVSNQVMSDDALWKNDVAQTSPVGAATLPEPGDLVVYVEEVSGTGKIDFSLTAIYETN